MGINIKKVSSVVSTMFSIDDTTEILGGININELNTSNLGSIKSSINQSQIDSQVNQMMEQLNSQINSSMNLSSINFM